MYAKVSASKGFIDQLMAIPLAMITEFIEWVQAGEAPLSYIIIHHFCILLHVLP